MALVEQVADPTRRVCYLRSYELAPAHNAATGLLPFATNGWRPEGTPFDGTRVAIYLRSGSVSVNGGPSITWPGAYIGKNQRDPLGISAGFQASAIHELYVDGTSGQVSLAVVADESVPFPDGSLPLYILQTDSVFRFQQVQDRRPSTSGMKSSFEVVADNSLRSSYANSFPFDEYAGPYSGPFQLQIGTGEIQSRTGRTFYGWELKDGPRPNLVTTMNVLPGYKYYISSFGVFTADAISNFPAGSVPLFVCGGDETDFISDRRIA